MVKNAMKWAILLVWWGGVALAAPVVKPPGTRMFDHDRHAQAALAGAKSGARATAVCADCHQMDAKGERKAGKEHAMRCVKCHKDPLTCNAVKVPGPASPARRCIICHVPTAGTNCQPNDMPPAPNKNTFQAGFAHGKHISFGAAIERECATCHKPQAPAGGGAGAAPAHSLCSACHDGQRSKLAMTNCAGCHQPPKAKAGPSGDPFRLARFDHKKHHAESKQASCTGCHTKEKMLSSAESAVPRPDMASCQNQCHNGTPGKPFSAVGTSCTKCHTGGGGTFPKNKTDLAFSHTSHAGRNVKISNCDACHALKPDGNLEAPGAGKNHMPCAASGCHLNEYLARPEKTKICGVCHDESLAWKKAIARSNPNQKEEWFENMNHATHLAKKGQTNAACGDCHGDKLGGGKKPGDHEACSQCHGKGAPAHDMTECAKCHVQTKPQGAVASEWSVAATFGHEKHATDPKTKKATQCVTCHLDVKNAKDLASIKKPVMSSCDACHDGKSSFKTTGYECARCHTKAKQPSTATSMLDTARDPMAARN